MESPFSFQVPDFDPKLSTPVPRFTKKEFGLWLLANDLNGATQYISRQTPPLQVHGSNMFVAFILSYSLWIPNKPYPHHWKWKIDSDNQSVFVAIYFKNNPVVH